MSPDAMIGCVSDEVFDDGPAAVSNESALRGERSARIVPWILAVGALDFGLEQFMVIPIVPAVQRDEGVPLSTATWLITGFLLASVVAAPLLGRLGDMYGKRRLLLVALVAFALGSLVCALAGSMGWLIAGRVLQGFGAAFGPLAIGLARDHAPRERVPVLVGLLVAASGAGAALGLLLGGVLVDHVSVAAVFWFLCALAVCLILAVAVFVPETAVRSPSRPDWAGAVLLATALSSVLLAISEGNTWGWASWPVVLLFVTSAAAFGAFGVAERSASAPLVDLRMMARRPAWSATVVAFAMGFSLFIAGVVIPQIATLPEASGYGFGLTITQTGLLLVPGALAIVVGGWASGAFVTVTGVRSFVAAGAVLSAVAYASLAIAHDTVAAVLLANVVLGFGIGFAIPALINLVVHAVGTHHTSVFTATTAVSRSVGAALGAQVAAAVVISAGQVEPGFPAESGFTDAFTLGLAATLVALAATLLLPATRSVLVAREA